MLNKYKKVIKLNFSNISEHDFNWIKIMLIGYLFTISIDIFFSLVTAYSLYDFYATMIIMTIVTIYLGYYGVNQSRILLPDFLVHEVTCNEGITLYEDLTKKNIKHQLSYSSDQEIEDLKLRLENVLRIDMPYLDENLTLKKLADMIPTSDKKLSTLLNQFMNISFYDLINKYRVEAIKGKMISEDNKKYTLLGLAYDCGFSSKSSFIRIFKKETGIPPSEYKKQLES
jgi:AraC-like DNA-binding protein